MDDTELTVTPMIHGATVLARVDVCTPRVGRAGRAISSLVLVVTLALSLPLLERVNMHPVIICTRVPFPDVAVGFAPKFRED